MYTAWFTGGQAPAGVFSRATGWRPRFTIGAMHPPLRSRMRPHSGAPGGIVLLAWHAKVTRGGGVFLRISRMAAPILRVVEVPTPLARPPARDRLAPPQRRFLTMAAGPGA